MSAGKGDTRPEKIGTARAGERGYALISLLAMMTIMALLLVEAVPNYRRMAQRELEEEAISRGEQVAEAIRLYVREKRALPTSIEQLLEGLPRGTKKIQILRAAAARDPLSTSGEWKLIRKNDRAFVEFQAKVTAYAGRAVNTNDAAFMAVAGPLPVVTNILDTGSEEEAAPGGEDDSEDTSGPFIGVASRSRRNSVISYYGIERHDRWIFTPYFR
ncbi:MAG TPA: type II secretion system protein [Pyrinomonadaceae bacterium]|nr:type II secretion system protein [Pyrinomonadaceae bacterium]